MMPNRTDLSYDQQRDEEDRHIEGFGEESDDPLGEGLPEGELIENPDGSVTLTEPEPEEVPQQDFYANLAEGMPRTERAAIASDLLEKIDRDKQAREKRDKQYKDGLERSGLSGDAPGGATFDGASRAVHPALAEACVDFAASAIKELFPPDGPVKAKIRGKETEERKARADRKVEYLNYQFTKQIVEYRDDLEQLLSQLPMGGSQYQKFRHDDRLKRPAVEFVPIDELLLPYAAANFYSSPRATHMQDITRHTFNERVASGLYFYEGNPDATADADLPERTGPQEANDKIEGKEQDCYNEDGLRRVYEVYTWYGVKDPLVPEGEEAPYIITVDKATEDVVAIYRNWEESDGLRRKLDWWVEWGFIPWRGAYKLGLPHLIGGLTIAMTGALRALLDSAHINNAATMLKLKSGRMSGQNTQVDIAQVMEIEGPAGVNDIRQLAMPMPFNPPSPVLFQLLGWLTDAAKGVVRTAEEKIADAGNNMPVGTALALIEQGSKVYSSIHARLHASQAKAMEILCRINAKWLDDQAVAEEFGEQIVTRQDFVRNADVQPVSDPNIFSEAQRFARWQAVSQMSQDQSVGWNKVEVYREGLRLMKVDDADRFLPPPPKPLSGDPIQENMAAVMQSIPLQATPQQDHLAHINEHLRFMLDPMQGSSPVVSGQALNNILQNVQQHLILFYGASAQVGAAPLVLQALEGGQQPDPDSIAAQAAASAAAASAEVVQAIMPKLQQAHQLVTSRMPPPPMDPTAATLKAAEMETERRAKLDGMTIDLKRKEAERDASFRAVEQQLEQQSAKFDQMLSHIDARQRAEADRRAQEVELLKNNRDNEMHQITELLKNRDDNETKVLIAQLQQGVSDLKERAMALEPRQDDSLLHRMQSMLSEIERAKSQDALSATIDGLRAVMSQMSRPRVATLSDGTQVRLE